MARALSRLNLAHRRDGVVGILERAAYCWRSGAGLFLLLTLMSAVYEGLVEKYALIPSFTISPSSDHNSSLEFKFFSRSTTKDFPHVAGVTEEDQPLFVFNYFENYSFLVNNQRNASNSRAVPVPETMANTSSKSLVSVPLENTSSQTTSNSLDSGSKVENGTTKEQALDPIHEVTGLESGQKRKMENEASKEQALDLIYEGLGPESVKNPSDRSTLASDEVSDDSNPRVEDVRGSGTGMRLSALKLRYVENTTKTSRESLFGENEILGFVRPRLAGRRIIDRRPMPRMGFTMLFVLMLLIGALALALAVITSQHAAVMGVICYSVVSTYMGKRVTLKQVVKAVFNCNIKRLIWLTIMFGTIQDLQCLVCLRTIFRGVLEVDQIESLSLRLSAMPFSLLAPFRDKVAVNWGMASRIGTFLVLDYGFDGIWNTIYIFACWVTIMEPESGDLAAVQRSLKLVQSMELQAFAIKLLEAALCGRSCRWVLQKFLGTFLSAFVTSGVQTYFTVVWLVSYISARYKHDGSSSFSHAILEDFLNRHR